MKPVSRAWLKHFVCLFVPGLILLSVVSFWSFQRDIAGELERRVAPVRAWLSFAEIQLAESLQGAGRDLVLLAATPDLGMKAQLEQTSKDFIRFLESHIEISELRVFDQHGNVLIWLGRRGKNIVLHPQVSGDKSAIKMIAELADVPRGAVRVSALSLEMLDDKIRLPHRPGVMLSMGFGAGDGRSAGAVQVRFNGISLYDRTAFGRPSETLALWMLDERSQWMFGGADKDNWRWQFPSGEGKSLAQRYVALWREMQRTADGLVNVAEGLFVFRQIDPVNTVTAADTMLAPVALLPERQPYFWYLVAPIRAAAQAEWEQGVRQAAWIRFSLALLVLVLIVAWIAQLLTRQLRLQALEVGSRHSLLQVLGQVPIGALLNDQKGQRIYVNPYWEKLTGMSANEADGNGWRKAIHPDDLNRVLLAWENVFNNKEIVELEWRFLRPDGEVNWARGALLPLRSNGDEVNAYIGVMADITPIKNQEALVLAGRRDVERAHEELDSILNSSSDPIVGIDMDFCFTVFNAAYADLFERLYGLVVVRGHCLLNELENLPDDRAKQMTLWGRAMQGERFVVRQIYGDASRERRTFDLSLSPQYASHGGLNGAVMIMRDVTVAARVEEALMRSEELFRSATESSLDAIIVLEAVKDTAWQVVDFRLVECNQVALDLFRRRRADCMGMSLGDVMPTSHSQGLFELLCQVQESGQSYEEERLIDSDHAAPVWLQYQIVAISSGVTLMVRDISQRKMVEQRLLDNEARTAAILANVQEGVMTLNTEGSIRSVNPACGRIFAYVPADLVGESIGFLFPQILTSLSRIGLVEALQVELGVERDVANVVNGVRRDGSLTMIEMSFKPVVLDEDRFYTVTLHDITERNAYESRLQQNIDELEMLQENLNLTNDQLSTANRELTRLAHLDGLTGLANRRYFDQTLQREWNRAIRDRQPLSVLMLDVDHFKRYNDGYGHQAGDECLKLIADSIARALHRPADFAARYGGEEFVVVLPNTDMDGAEQVANWILTDVRAQAIPHANSPTAAYVTISAGVACALSPEGVNEHSLVSSADQALYLAKQRGRNQLARAAGN